MNPLEIAKHHYPLKTEIDKTFETLIEVFSSFPQNQLDVVPFEGSWTAGQVGEHIVKFASGIPQFFNTKIEPTHRPFDEKKKELQALFLDMSQKMKSPDFIVPTETQHNKENLLISFKTIEGQMQEAVESMDLKLTCGSFELPGTGFLTRFEWLAFFLAHTQRHIVQLQKIKGSLV